jgi:hypothetical protein
MSEYAWISLGDGRQAYRKIDTGPPPQRSDLPTPMVITDTMDAVQHPCTGEFMTSKAAFRAVTKAHGCIEMGNDPARLRPRQKPKPDRKAIRDSLAKARARFNRGERAIPK